MSIPTVARRHAAKILISLSKGEPPDTTTTEAVSDGRIEVTVIVRPVRYLVTQSPSLDSFLAELRKRHGLDVAPLAPAAPCQEPQSATVIDLDDTDRTVLSVLSTVFQKARTIAIAAGFAPRTASVRISLAKLVRLGLAVNERGRGYRLA